MEEAIGCGNGQTACDDNTPADLLDALNLPIPTWSPVVEVFCQDCPRHVGQGDAPLLPLLEMAIVNGAMQFSKGLRCALLLELRGADAVGGLDAVHWNLCGLLLPKYNRIVPALRCFKCSRRLLPSSPLSEGQVGGDHLLRLTILLSLFLDGCYRLLHFRLVGPRGAGSLLQKPAPRAT